MSSLKALRNVVIRISDDWKKSPILLNIAQNLINHNENLFSIVLEHFQDSSRYGFWYQKNFLNSTKKICLLSRKHALRKRFKVSLNKICIKKMKFEIFFSRIRKLDLDMIWDHDRYVKASPGSTLQSSNNGLIIFDDLGRKSGIFSAS